LVSQPVSQSVSHWTELRAPMAPTPTNHTTPVHVRTLIRTYLCVGWGLGGRWREGRASQTGWFRALDSAAVLSSRKEETADILAARTYIDMVGGVCLAAGRALVRILCGRGERVARRWRRWGPGWLCCCCVCHYIYKARTMTRRGPACSCMIKKSRGVEWIDASTI
jgi:hypothetical protein